MERGPADVYRRYERLFPHCSPDDVDDAMSVAAIAAYHSVHTAREPINDAPAFQYRVMSRFLIRATKRRYRFVFPDQAESATGWDAIEDVRDEGRLLETTETLEDRLETEAILDHLPAHYAQVLNLHYLEGYTLEEAAHKVGVSGPCMRKRHERALKVARKIMGVQSNSLQQQNNGGNVEDAVTE